MVELNKARFPMDLPGRIGACLAVLLMAASPALFAQETVELEPVLDLESLYQPIQSELIYGQTATDLIKELEEKHYSRVEIDDDFSSLLLDTYLDVLDGSRLYFVQDDIDRFEGYRYNLDDSLEQDDQVEGREDRGRDVRRIALCVAGKEALEVSCRRDIVSLSAEVPGDEVPGVETDVVYGPVRDEFDDARELLLEQLGEQ